MTSAGSLDQTPDARRRICIQIVLSRDRIVRDANKICTAFNEGSPKLKHWGIPTDACETSGYGALLQPQRMEEPLLNTCQSNKMKIHFDGLALYPQT